MKGKKAVLIYIAVVIVVILAAGYIIFDKMGEAWIKGATEKAASGILGVPLTIKDLDLEMLRGKVLIYGLVIQNPPRYANKTLLEAGEITMHLDTLSLLSDTMRIQLIKVDSATLTIEQKGRTNNLKEILGNIPKGEAGAESKGKKLEVKRLEVTNTNVRVKLLPVPGKRDTISLKLSPIVMENLGGPNFRMGMVTSKVVTAMATGVARQGAGLLPTDMIKGIGSSAAKISKSAAGSGAKALKGAGSAGKGIIKGFKGGSGGKKGEVNEGTDGNDTGRRDGQEAK